MRLVSYVGGFGRVEGDHLVRMGDDLVSYLEHGRAQDGDEIELAQLDVLAPVPRPRKIVCVGLNYRDHADETGQDLPQRPVLFAKFANSVVGPGAAVVVPPETEKVDYEAELGVVIGRRARKVSRESALSYVAGYTCCNDVSARDLQFESAQWTRGKAIDTFLPVGPVLLTADEIEDPQRLGIRSIVSGEVMQDSKTSEMVFSVAELVSFISRTMTLEPGDIIATGTPAGVGFVRQPPRFLQDGDEVTIEIEKIGSLTNPISADR